MRRPQLICTDKQSGCRAEQTGAIDGPKNGGNAQKVVIRRVGLPFHIPRSCEHADL